MKQNIRTVAENKTTTIERLQASGNAIPIRDLAWISAMKLEILEGGTIENFIYHHSVKFSRGYRYTFRKKVMRLYETHLVNDPEIIAKIEFNRTLHGLLNMGQSHEPK